jgi:hypothetical protein
MATTNANEPKDAAFWTLALETWRASGLRISEFCRREGLCASSFYRWRRRLTAGGSTKDSPNDVSEPSDVDRDAPSSRPVFVPVAFDSAEQAKGPSTGFSGVEIRFAHRHTLRVEPGFDRETLAKVLSILETVGC